MPRRYDIKKDPDELWTVYDIFTGWPAELGGLVLAGLSERAAKKFIGRLNLKDHLNRMEDEGDYRFDKPESGS